MVRLLDPLCKPGLYIVCKSYLILILLHSFVGNFPLKRVITLRDNEYYSHFTCYDLFGSFWSDISDLDEARFHNVLHQICLATSIG